MRPSGFREWIRIYVALPYDPVREGFDAVVGRALQIAEEECTRQFDQQAGARERRGWTRSPDGTLAPPAVERQHRTADLADRIWALRRALDKAEAEYQAYLAERVPTATAEATPEGS